MIRRGNSFHLRKRVPLRYRPVEPRAEVWISLRTDSESAARAKAKIVWDEMIEGWEARLAGETDDALARFEAARVLAARRRFRFLPPAEVAKLPVAEIVERVHLAHDHAGRPIRAEVEALLGTAAQPKITVSGALEAFWDLAKDRTLGKSEDQLRRWKAPRRKAVTNFIAAVGDRQIDRITADDMLDFRQWWIDKIEREGLTANSANKDLVHLSDILKTVNRKKRLGLVLPLSDLALKEGAKRQRPAFSTDWITKRLMAPGALDGLNTEARAILLGMVNTGYRPSEGAALLPEHIRLDGKVPHIAIEAEGRTLKSQYARRVIPLAGVSLDAIRAFAATGFPRYRDNPVLSDTINKFLAENGLKESEAHTLYSLRHSFEDRMLAAGVDERIRRDLMGHRLTRERYGQGASLEHLHRVVESVAL